MGPSFLLLPQIVIFLVTVFSLPDGSQQPSITSSTCQSVCKKSFHCFSVQKPQFIAELTPASLQFNHVKEEIDMIGICIISIYMICGFKGVMDFLKTQIKNASPIQAQLIRSLFVCPVISLCHSSFYIQCFPLRYV